MERVAVLLADRHARHCSSNLPDQNASASMLMKLNLAKGGGLQALQRFLLNCHTYAKQEGWALERQSTNAVLLKGKEIDVSSLREQIRVERLSCWRAFPSCHYSCKKKSKIITHGCSRRKHAWFDFLMMITTQHISLTSSALDPAAQFHLWAVTVARPKTCNAAGSPGRCH